MADYIDDFEIGVDALEMSGFGFNGVGDLAWTSVSSGIALQLAPTHFVVFVGHECQETIEAGSDIWSFEQRYYH